VEPLGEMLDQAWEEYAIWLANAANATELASVLVKIIEVTGLDLSSKANVIVGRDTRCAFILTRRPSGLAFIQAVSDGVLAMGGSVQDHGVVTTPHLHYLTRSLNTAGTPQQYGEPTLNGYYNKLAGAFRRIVV
jgi:phosphoacetylglucosamine mutase